GRGQISKALKVTAHAFSESAKRAIENAGGEVVIAGA
ncbi:MAG: uL15 family ribosomal protein, partial [Flavobacteriales bacterium]|nr:uL15 family ribosomal protein [Flavobacteriales bacterium]